MNNDQQRTQQHYCFSTKHLMKSIKEKENRKKEAEIARLHESRKKRKNIDDLKEKPHKNNLFYQKDLTIF